MSGYRTFADYPGFQEYYKGACTEGREPAPVGKDEKELLTRFSPRVILSPGNRYPMDFFKEYLPFTFMRRFPGKSIITEKVTPELLKEYQYNKQVYLDFQLERFQEAGLDRRVPKGEQDVPHEGKENVIYGRLYRDRVTFPCGTGANCFRDLTFLKYNIVFPISGLAKRLPFGYEFFLKLAGVDPDNWHELDNFVAIHIVLNEEMSPFAVILAQHNHHRTYLIGKDILLPPDVKIPFSIALRSNEVYLSSDLETPVEHRVIRWVVYLKYLLSGQDHPFFHGYDITRGIQAGGKEISYTLAFLSPCDPFYTAKIMLGEPRPFLGRYIGRNGPPGADYYAVPGLLPLGNLMNFSYLQDGDLNDIKLVEKAIDIKKKRIDIEQIVEYGGATFYRDLKRIETR
jgi:hypothetical protein